MPQAARERPARGPHPVGKPVDEPAEQQETVREGCVDQLTGAPGRVAVVNPQGRVAVVNPQRHEDQQERQRDHPERAGLDADVEADQRRRKLPPREPVLAGRGGKAEAMQQAEQEHHERASSAQPVGEDVLHRHEYDRRGDEGFDDGAGDRDPARRSERQCERMGECQSSGPIRADRKNSPSTKRIWSNPFGRMWPKPTGM